MLNKSLWSNDIIICITFDMDWASEETLKDTMNIISEYGFPTTFFVTHYSKIIFDKINRKIIHGGIYPNFLKNSSHGKNMMDIIEHCTKLLPDANCFRCHKYFDSDDVTQELYQRGFKYDSNLCTNLDRVEPFVHKSGLVRFPVFFEDGTFLLHNNTLSFKDFERRVFKEPGLYIFNFHPMQLVINSPDFKYMKKIKESVSKDTWKNLTHKELEHIAFKGKGIRSFTLELFNYIKREGLKTLTLEDIYKSIIT